MHKQRLIRFWRKHADFPPEVIEAFDLVDRANFVPEKLKQYTYNDRPLPITRGKTISQPSTVMFMTTLLEIKKGMKIFEVGTGSGYQAAILAKMTGKKGKVITTEIIPELVDYSKKALFKEGIDNVEIIEKDGSKGYEDKAPYDRIIITAACKEFPKELLEQLKPEGIIVGPVGSKKEQEMVRGYKDKKGRLEIEFLGQFLFTPLYGKYGFEI